MVYYIDIQGIDIRKLKIRKNNTRMKYPIRTIVGGFDSRIEAQSFMAEYSDDLAQQGYFIVRGDGNSFFNRITAESTKNHEVIIMNIIEEES